MLQNKNIGTRAQLQLLHTLFNSRWSYGSELLASISKPFRVWLRSQWYRSLKDLIGINFNISACKLFEVCLGKQWECWLSDKAKRLFVKLQIERNPFICNHVQHDDFDPKELLPIQVIA